MSRRGFPIEGHLLLYFIFYLPNVIITKLVTSTPHPQLGRPLTGLETLPASLIISTVLTYLFIWWAGWHKDANGVMIAGRRIPVPTKWTLISGFGTALVLFTVPLSFTFENVSIPFMQLLMRGDILLIAPLVDLAFGRRVRWWSWTALVLVLGAMILTVSDRGGFYLPPLAILTIVLYTLGYFVRLAVMTKVSKNGEPASIRKYFVEEKVFALPASVAILALISASGIGAQSDSLAWGFLYVWTDPVILPLLGIGTTLTIVSVFAIIILLNPRENAYCVPLERAASLVAGVLGALILAWVWGLPEPRASELIGAGVLVGAIVLLSLAPRLFDKPGARA